MAKNKKNSSPKDFKMTPESLQELDKETLVSLLVKIHEQYQCLSEAMQAFMRDRHGPKTEHFVDPDQLNLFQNEEQTDDQNQDGLETQNTCDSSETKKKGQGGGKERGKNPRQSNLTRVPIRGKKPSAELLRCKCCNLERRLVNEVKRGSRYAYQPASVLIEEFLASIFACTSCGDTLVVEPDVPPAALKIGADAKLVSVIAVERFDDSIPLHRQERRFARLGAPIAKSSMCGWLAATSKLLRPIYNKMKIVLVMSKVIATDDTPMKVQDRSKSKNIKLGRIWIYYSDDEHPVNLFDYTCDRGRAGPKTFLQGYKGFLLGDCFSGNQALCAETGCTHVACNAHGTRYFIKAEPNNKKACAEILRMYNNLFKIEREAKELDVTGAQLKLMREQEAKPILDKMKVWLDHHSITALPKSSFGKAVHYCLNNWNELTNYLLDGDLRLDNNLAEQEMKRVAINRKNSLFFGSDKGGEDAEVFMSLISTCRRNNIDPFAYLKDVIERLTENPDEDPHLLVPHNWVPRIRDAEIPGVAATPKLILATAR